MRVRQIENMADADLLRLFREPRKADYRQLAGRYRKLLPTLERKSEAGTGGRRRNCSGCRRPPTNPRHRLLRRPRRRRGAASRGGHRHGRSSGRAVDIPWAGPHRLDVDVAGRRLFCACDGATLVEVGADTGDIRGVERIAGPPDVVFFNAGLQRLYVAVGDPGVIEVFATSAGCRHESVPTESGTHTLAFDPARNLVCALLLEPHRVAIYVDGASPPQS